MLSVTDTCQTPLHHTISLWQDTTVQAPKVLLIGGFHGDEGEGVYLLNRLIDTYRTDAQGQRPYQLDIIPCFNPDGVSLNTRENAHRIDLNRNWPTANFQAVTYNPHSGQASSGAPASECETRWLMRYFDTNRPALILSVHSDLKMVDYDGPEAHRHWAHKIADLTGYPAVKNVGYPTPGSFGTWAGVEGGFPVVTLETEKATTPDGLSALWDKCAPLMNLFL